MSRPDRAPGVGVDFAPPPAPSHTRAVIAIAVAVLLSSAITVAVTQLLLR
ncbi:MAG TPA: hypothetical protein VFR68_13175 [Candidatus Dormibacteraeota bacterium]|nr:hypothetical protein [Candidatus Dormibacteraeota bacterium]